MRKNLLFIPFVVVLVPSIFIYVFLNLFSRTGVSPDRGISSPYDTFKQFFGVTAVGLYLAVLFVIFRSNIIINDNLYRFSWSWHDPMFISKVVGSVLLLIITLLTVQYCIDEAWRKSKSLNRIIGGSINI